eukprot:GFYU01001108.1.p1 GENE.GFYU01001108.1~~GFYU01001108.1.p1  ORF type:complete len:229 (+),score=35.72 GFYU01001108.1:127-813(+)
MAQSIAARAKAAGGRGHFAREKWHWLIVILTMCGFIICYAGLSKIPVGNNIYHAHGANKVSDPVTDHTRFHVPVSKVGLQWVTPLWAFIISIVVLASSSRNDRDSLLVAMLLIAMELVLLVTSASLLTRATFFCREYECVATATQKCQTFAETDACSQGYDIFTTGISMLFVFQVCLLASAFSRRQSLSSDKLLGKNPTTFATPSLEAPSTIPTTSGDIYLDQDSMVD